MLRISVIRTVAPRVRYFLRAPALSPSERKGQWLGSGCAPAGINIDEPISETDFSSALRGYAPDGRYLGQQRKANRRGGWDIVLSSSKSVSVAALCLDNPIGKSVRDSWSAAVHDFIPALESLAARSDAGRPLMPTGNLIVAAFTHERSRRNDPHLHTHFVTINATLDRRTGNSWRGLEAAPFFRHNLLLDGLFQRELLRHLHLRGVPASLDKSGRVQMPVPEDICARLSQAKAILDNAEQATRLPSLETVRNRDNYRNILNDRLRPPKMAPTSPLRSTLNSSERSRISRACTRKSPPPAPPAPPPATEIATQIEGHYHKEALWHSTKRLFRAMLETARELTTVPIDAILRALPLVANPRPLSSSAPSAFRFARKAKLQHWQIGRAKRSMRPADSRPRPNSSSTLPSGTVAKARSKQRPRP